MKLVLSLRPKLRVLKTVVFIRAATRRGHGKGLNPDYDWYQTWNFFYKIDEKYLKGPWGTIG